MPRDGTPTSDPEKLRSLARLVRAWLQRQDGKERQRQADAADADEPTQQPPTPRRPRRPAK